jgi:hypothetical protein
MIDNIIVIDNVVSKNYQDMIEEKTMLDLNFPWFFNPSISTHNPELMLEEDSFGFSHLFCSNTVRPMQHISQFLIPLVYEACGAISFKVNEICMGRVFMTVPVKHKKSPRNMFHTDLPGEPHLVCLYYVNDSSGPTVITKLRDTDITQDNINAMADPPISRLVEPKKGRAVLFDGSLYHTSTDPDFGRRCIVNFSVK